MHLRAFSRLFHDSAAVVSHQTNDINHSCSVVSSQQLGPIAPSKFKPGINWTGFNGLNSFNFSLSSYLHCTRNFWTGSAEPEFKPWPPNIMDSYRLIKYPESRRSKIPKLACQYLYDPPLFLLRCMECRGGLTMRILSVRPSVCPSVTRVHCDKTE